MRLLSFRGRFLYHLAVLELCNSAAVNTLFLCIRSPLKPCPLVALSFASSFASSLPCVKQDAEVEAPVAAAAQGDPELAGLEARLANLKR